jgi:hypothetical protein
MKPGHAPASAEYYLDEYLLTLDKPLPLQENIVLIEAYRQVQPRFLAETAYRIITVKHLRPLIAHPERYDMFDAILPESGGKIGPVLLEII